MANKVSEQNTDSEHESLPAISKVRLENISLDWDGIQFEKLIKSKRGRSSMKGTLTKVQNKIKGLILNPQYLIGSLLKVSTSG